MDIEEVQTHNEVTRMLNDQIISINNVSIIN